MPSWRSFLAPKPDVGVAPDLPYGTDWRWRPDLWAGPVGSGWASVAAGTRLGRDVAVFHDCPLAEISLRQGGGPAPPMTVEMEVFAFRGAFLSLAIDLPRAAISGLREHHIIDLDLDQTAEKPLDVFARLNIRHGPNTAQVVQEIPRENGPHKTGFDLAYSNLDVARIGHAWLDLIFEAPEMNRLSLRDVTLSRRIRAQV